MKFSSKLDMTAVSSGCKSFSHSRMNEFSQFLIRILIPAAVQRLFVTSFAPIESCEQRKVGAQKNAHISLQF